MKITISRFKTREVTLSNGKKILCAQHLGSYKKEFQFLEELAKFISQNNEWCWCPYLDRELSRKQLRILEKKLWSLKNKDRGIV